MSVPKLGLFKPPRYRSGHEAEFDTEDMGHRLLTMAQMAAADSLAVHVPAALGATSAGFALSYTGKTRQLHRFLIPHYVIALLGFVTGAVSGMLPVIALLGILALLCMAQIFFSLREMPSADMG
jgi:low temperature requirement protein LtrA